MFPPSIALDAIENNVRLRINQMEGHKMYEYIGRIDFTVAIWKQKLLVKFIKCLSGLLICNLKANLLSCAIITDQIMTETNVSLRVSCELDNGHCGVLQPTEEKQGLRIFDKVSFYKQTS
jgi:hypothetical protein